MWGVRGVARRQPLHPPLAHLLVRVRRTSFSLAPGSRTPASPLVVLPVAAVAVLAVTDAAAGVLDGPCTWLRSSALVWPHLASFVVVRTRLASFGLVRGRSWSFTPDFGCPFLLAPQSSPLLLS
jgi:hypothetical protein